MDSTQYSSDKYISTYTNAANRHLLKVNNRNTRKRYEICSKLAIKTPEQYQRCRYCLSVVNFKQVNVSWKPYFDTKVNACQRKCQHSNLPKGIFVSK